jgi:D-aminopeptidase
MKTSLTLSAVLFALTLTPVAFANGAQEQTQETAAPVTSAMTVTVANTTATSAVTRSALAQIEVDVRQNLVSSLRESGLRVLQVATPAVVRAASISTQLDLTAR